MEQMRGVTMKFMGIDEAAACLRVHPETLKAKARTGEIPGAKPGKEWVFLDVDLADYLRSQYRPANEPRYESCRSTRAATSTGASGRSAAKKLEKLLAAPTKQKLKNS
jgi:excisionase family DNA binding protein